MSGQPQSPQFEAVRQALAGMGLPVDVEAEMRPLAGDGSDRSFVRVSPVRGGSLLVVLPNSLHPRGMDEARAAGEIGRHLFAAGVAVPEIFAFDPTSGILVMEDLGDQLFHDFLRGRDEISDVVPWYRKAIDELIRLQVEARPGFPSSACWETPCYDKKLMVERESGYFYEALCRGYLGMDEAAPVLTREFAELAELAAGQPADFVMHRDFQSRNLMIHQERVRIIDFQGARLGPPGYDIASLLIDPYAGLPATWQEDLLGYYLDRIAFLISLDRDRFIEGYYYLLLQRNLQILGAFSFLWLKRRKPFFKEYIKPAAESLDIHLSKPQGARFSCLRSLARQVRARIDSPEIRKTELS